MVSPPGFEPGTT